MEQKDMLQKCLSGFKTNTGYDFCELLRDKNRFNSCVEEYKKKDLAELITYVADMKDKV